MDMVLITAIMFWDSLTKPLHDVRAGQTSHFFASNTITIDIKCDWQKDATALYKVRHWLKGIKRNHKVDFWRQGSKQGRHCKFLQTFQLCTLLCLLYLQIIAGNHNQLLLCLNTGLRHSSALAIFLLHLHRSAPQLPYYNIPRSLTLWHQKLYMYINHVVWCPKCWTPYKYIDALLQLPFTFWSLQIIMGT